MSSSDNSASDKSVAKRVASEIIAHSENSQPLSASSSSTETLNGANGVLSAKRAKTEKDHIAASTGFNFGVSINADYCQSDFKEEVKARFKTYGNNNDLEVPKDNVDPVKNIVFRQPFRHLIFENFFSGSLDQLEDELLSLKFQPLQKDLFQLTQTKELTNPDVTEFSWLATYFKSEIRTWVSEITGITLSDEVDMRGAMYRYTDFLMCHDDRLSTRKIAYVYYLTDQEWSEEDGGTLDLFDSVCVDDTPVPAEVRKRILPKRNSLVLFVVNDDSFHQVREVLNPRKSRLSITGWFHVPSAPALRPLFQDAPTVEPVEFREANVDHARMCVLAQPDNPQNARQKAVWRKEFLKSQQITVPSLLNTNFYQNLVKELQTNDRIIEWKIPANRNQAGHYKYLDLRHPIPRLPYLSFLLRTMVTDQFLQSLTDITSVDMNSNLCGPPEPVVKEKRSSSSAAQDTRWFINTFQFRLERFTHGDYTLRTYDAVQQDNVLDVFFHFDCDRLDRDCGGGITFVEGDDDDEWDVIAKIMGRSNYLNLVKRDEGVVLCTEYVNQRWERRANGRPFYRIWLSLPAIELPENARASSSSNSGSSEEDESEDESSGLDEEREEENIPPQVSGDSGEE